MLTEERRTQEKQDTSVSTDVQYTWKGTCRWYSVIIVQISNSILLSVVTVNILNNIIFKYLEYNNIMFIEASLMSVRS